MLPMLRNAVWAIASLSTVAAQKPNILLIMTDDQDFRMNSLAYQPAVQSLIVEAGTLFENHFATTSMCCPSRVSLLRGQASHNTNITHVVPPGGGYLKWLVSGQDTDYLPKWLGQAGYKTEYLGKLMNGQSLLNWKVKPKDWDHVDVLLEPYTYVFNKVVMSANGEKPIYYNGWHQSDVMRAKSIARLQNLTSQSSPWFLTIAPTAPHVEKSIPPIPCERHKTQYSSLGVPKPDNFNPPDEYQSQKPTFIKGVKPLTAEEIENADFHYRSRIQANLGVDEIVEDVVKLLEEKGVLDNTYIIYTTDNGYHIGTHRLFSGKQLPYLEDTNIPFVVRGPGIPSGAVSKVASTHIDLAPTFLDIAGVPLEDRPEFFDGRSLLSEWKNGGNGDGRRVDREIVNVEYWGGYQNEWKGGRFDGNTYKTLRIVSGEVAWLYSRWCNGDAELYDTKNDPYELKNLALNPTPAHEKIMLRLNALLLVTKSCIRQQCRFPWSVLTPSDSSLLPAPSSLTEAMDPKYDAHFASFPLVSFKECMMYQLPSNEVPFLPEDAPDKLGKAHRKPTDNFNRGTTGDCEYVEIKPNGHFGTEEQRSATLEDVERSARVLTGEELPGDDCRQIM